MSSVTVVGDNEYRRWDIVAYSYDMAYGETIFAVCMESDGSTLTVKVGFGWIILSWFMRKIRDIEIIPAPPLA